MNRLIIAAAGLLALLAGGGQVQAIIVFDDGCAHTIDTAITEDIAIYDGPGGTTTTVNIVPGGTTIGCQIFAYVYSDNYFSPRRQLFFPSQSGS